VVKSEAFKEKMQKLGILVGELESAPGDRSNEPARELVKLLMEVHGTAIERLLEIVFDSGPASEVILAKAGDDAIVRQLLLLYSLHPEDLETRVLKALDSAAPRLRKHNSEVEVISIHEGAIQLKFHISGHACGSTSKTVKSLLEECVYDVAPDLISLQIFGPDDEPSSGFVSLDSLLKHPLPAHDLVEQGAEVVGAD
jgi:Fe-S cluster biogenesis protein NfuA